MQPSEVEYSRLYELKGDMLEAREVLRVDDKVIVGCDGFLELEEERARAFIYKPKKSLEAFQPHSISWRYLRVGTEQSGWHERKSFKTYVTPTT